MRASIRRSAVFIVFCAMETQGARVEAARPEAQLRQAQKKQDKAITLGEAGKYAKAQTLALQSLSIRETILGKNHPDVAKSLNSLAILYADQGAYASAEPLYQRALQIYEAALGANHPNVSKILNNLATLYKYQGAYMRAESLYQRALQIRETALGENHPDIAKVLNNLAGLYEDQGAYERAEPLYQRALQVRETALGKNHPDVAKVLNNLAGLYESQGAYERAELMYQRALQILETTLGKNHPSVAIVLNSLGGFYMEQGAYELAEPLLLRALRIRESTQGKKHLDTARSLSNLAYLCGYRGDYKRAKSYLTRAVQIRNHIQGERHDDVAKSLHGFALIDFAQKRFNSAWPLFERSFTLSEIRLHKEGIGLSEPRLASFLRLLRQEDETLYNLLRTHPTEATVRRLAMTTTLLRKGRSAGELADISRAIYRSLGDTDRERFQRLRALRFQLMSLSLNGPGALSPAAYQERLKDLEAQGDAIESELARISLPLRAQQQLPTIADVIPRVAATLPPDGALIEIIAYAARPVVPPPNTPPSKVPGTPAYLALILHPSGEIRVADLGPAAPIDAAVGRLHRSITSRDTDYFAASQDLYRRLFQPLVPLLGQQRQLFIAPDGQLNLVPFAALHDGTHFLVDTHDIIYLTSGKDLLPRPSDVTPSTSVMVIADPTLTASPAAPAKLDPPSTTMSEYPASLERFTRKLSPSSDTSDTGCPDLPGTREEADAIARLFPGAHLMLQTAATKDAFMQLTAPGLLHVATHGYYFENDSHRGFGCVGDLMGSATEHKLLTPLLRSGLVLAGVRAPMPPHSPQQTPQEGTAPTVGRRRIEDSLVTALEIAGMNLWGTQLVVLSACATGRGDVQLGQGVYGLRRAFTVAGAETLVTSLWNVNDKTTQHLMADYYQRLLAGQGRAHALRQAMETLRAEHPHPYYWAPFIVVGNGAPLRGFSPPAQTTSSGRTQ